LTQSREITGRIRNKRVASKVTSAEEAAALITPGSTIGMSGFTGAGYPKAVPAALARRITEANESGDGFSVSVWTGASTAPELDGQLAAVDGIDLRMPYQSDPVSRAKINAGGMDYLDLHLSHVAQMVWEGFFGHLDLALVEVAGVTEDGDLVPSSSVGNNKTWLDLADRVILEVNSWQPIEMEGIHDIYYGTALPPHASRSRFSIQLIASGCRTFSAIRRRSSRSYERTLPIATHRSIRRTMRRNRSPGTSWSSWATRLGGGASRRLCCHCNRGWAILPTPC
jgi:succinyl-CoA:acetate CoA-transferase